MKIKTAVKFCSAEIGFIESDIKKSKNENVTVENWAQKYKRKSWSQK